MGKKENLDDFLPLTPQDFLEPERKKEFTAADFRAVKKLLKDFGIYVTEESVPEHVKSYAQLMTWKMELIRAK